MIVQDNVVGPAAPALLNNVNPPLPNIDSVRELLDNAGVEDNGLESMGAWVPQGHGIFTAPALVIEELRPDVLARRRARHLLPEPYNNAVIYDPWCDRAILKFSQ